MQARTQFPPEPRSASAARHWVRQHLHDMGRHDLVAAAEAGVSELVTNGILHAQTSIGLQVSRNKERVVIEVYDGSPMSDQPTLDTSTPNPVESTIGRGLRIVRAYAREWGVSTGHHGKAIWFQPEPDPSVQPTFKGNGTRTADRAGGGGAGGDEADVDEPFDLDSAIADLADLFPEDVGADVGADEDPVVQVRLLGVPLCLVHHYRKRWLELVREMQLVALGEPSPQQEIARRFCYATRPAHTDLYVIERSAVEYGLPVAGDTATVDAVFDVRRSMHDAYVEIRDLARDLERSSAGAQLLFVHPGAQAAELREWWLGEFIGQIDGAEPTPWQGERRVVDEGAPSAGNA